jgi:hypothetical protein
MAQELDDYDLWRRVVERLTGEGASMAEAIEGADLILHAHRRTRDQTQRAPPQGAGAQRRPDWASSSAAGPSGRQTRRTGE